MYNYSIIRNIEHEENKQYTCNSTSNILLSECTCTFYSQTILKSCFSHIYYINSKNVCEQSKYILFHKNYKGQFTPQ